MGTGVTLEDGPSLEEVSLEGVLCEEEVFSEVCEEEVFWPSELDETGVLEEVDCEEEVFSEVCEEEVFSEVCEEEVFWPSELDGAGVLEEVVCEEETSLVKTGADEELCPPEEPQETSASKARTENGISFFI